jgi:hypothetical protein
MAPKTAGEPLKSLHNVGDAADRTGSLRWNTLWTSASPQLAPKPLAYDIP